MQNETKYEREIEHVSTIKDNQIFATFSKVVMS